ncbi:aminotransferase class V-fold PLP-dependent enzyme [Pedobacter sp. SYP-B3415]|uniref:aminotransferase class V-fold PLP-dependent enzyme n=1 Tax=Pedobacter sp. SYP-B3415 TaxID=2496641 RepID=UPI00101D2F12|nr:aminotransferase class V-fold PLP-dependent enzyme [Pedobacter sp. SYP-B3415]
MNRLVKFPVIFNDAELARFRQDTPGVLAVTHLNNAGAGLMPDQVTKAVLDHIRFESETGGYEAAAAKADAIGSFYTLAGELLNCKPENIAFTASATDAYTRALSSIPFSGGDVILTDKDDFVSNQLQFLACQKRFGVRIVHIENAQQGGVDLSDLEYKLFKLKPKLLAITHIPTNSGLIQPVTGIAEIYSRYRDLHDEPTWYILDACQSVGQLKLDVNALACDFLSVTARKFLRGPRGTGFLYVSDRALNAGLEPLFIDMRGAEWTSASIYKQRPGAVRFEDWEFAYALVLGTAEAIRYYLGIGETRISRQIQHAAHYLRSRLSEIGGLRVLDRGAELGGLVTFTFDGLSDPADLFRTLSRARFNVVPSYRQYAVLDFDEKKAAWAVRASPHYYNTQEELDNFIAEVAGFAVRLTALS